MVCIQKQHMNLKLLDGKNLCLKVLISLLHVLSHMVQSNINTIICQIMMCKKSTCGCITPSGAVHDANYTLEEPCRQVYKATHYTADDMNQSLQ